MPDSFRTRAVHAGRHDLTELGVHAPPLDYSSTYPISSLEEGVVSIDSFIEGKAEAKNPIYSRLFNPTVGRWEQGVCELEGGSAAVEAIDTVYAYCEIEVDIPIKLM